MKSPYDIIRMMIERIIIPKYPFLKKFEVDSMRFTKRREYDVRFHVKEKPSPEIQTEVDEEILSLFKLASLDERENNSTARNTIYTWYKTPNSKDWSFKSTSDYLRSR